MAYKVLSVNDVTRTRWLRIFLRILAVGFLAAFIPWIMWPAGQRVALARRAAGHDAAIVLGCDAAVETVRSSLASTGRRVVPGMEVEGVMNVVPSAHLPLDVRLELRGVSRLRENQAGASP